MLERNDLVADDIISILFTATPDLTAEFPAYAARLLGLTDVPLMCASEIAVPGAMPRMLRLLAHVETDRARAPRSGTSTCAVPPRCARTCPSSVSLRCCSGPPSGGPHY